MDSLLFSKLSILAAYMLALPRLYPSLDLLVPCHLFGFSPRVVDDGMTKIATLTTCLCCALTADPFMGHGCRFVRVMTRSKYQNGCLTEPITSTLAAPLPHQTANLGRHLSPRGPFLRLQNREQVDVGPVGISPSRSQEYTVLQ